MWVKTQWNCWFGEIYKKNLTNLKLGFHCRSCCFAHKWKTISINYSPIIPSCDWSKSGRKMQWSSESFSKRKFQKECQHDCKVIVLFMYCIIRLHCSCKDCKWLWRSKFSFKFALCPVCPSLLGLPHLSHCSICRRPQMQSNQPTEPQHSKCRNITEIESNIIPSKST